MLALYVCQIFSSLVVLKLTLSQTTLLSLLLFDDQSSANNFHFEPFVLFNDLLGTFAITFGNTIETVLYNTLFLNFRSHTLSLHHNGVRLGNDE